MKISITFSLAIRKGETTDAPIRMRISYNGQRLDIRTGFVCPPAAWDARTQRMYPGTVNRYRERAAAINSKLDEQERCIDELLAKYDLDGILPDKNKLRSEFEDLYYNRKSSQDTEVLNLFDQYMQEVSKEKGWSLNTVNNYLALRIRLTDARIATTQISRFGNKEFETILNLFVDSGALNTSTDRMIGYLNSFLNWCKDKELYQGKTFKAKLKGAKSDKTIYYLEWNEVMRIKDLPIAYEPADIARDTFLFQCFTGLRHSDVAHLKWSNIDLAAKVPYMIITTIKTDDTIRIELNNHAIAILNKYQDRKKTSNSVFPPMTLGAKNRQLTQIAKLANLQGTIHDVSFCGTRRIETTIARADAISSHWGRHTFIVHALSIGISPIVVMSWTGHSDYESMKPYIAIVDSVKAESMQKFNE